MKWSGPSVKFGPRRFFPNLVSEFWGFSTDLAQVLNENKPGGGRGRKLEIAWAEYKMRLKESKLCSQMTQASEPGCADNDYVILSNVATSLSLGLHLCSKSKPNIRFPTKLLCRLLQLHAKVHLTQS